MMRVRDVNWFYLFGRSFIFIGNDVALLECETVCFVTSKRSPDLQLPQVSGERFPFGSFLERLEVITQKCSPFLSPLLNSFCPQLHFLISFYTLNIPSDPCPVGQLKLKENGER